MGLLTGLPRGVWACAVIFNTLLRFTPMTAGWSEDGDFQSSNCTVAVGSSLHTLNSRVVKESISRDVV